MTSDSMSAETDVIPDWALRAANDAMAEFRWFNEPMWPGIIAKAIHGAVMAERERCAKIADEEAAGRDWQRADANAHNDKRAARDFESMKIEAVQIASAIRATPKAGG